ncbi:MAG: lipopolysaccharide heptosyltransferase II [Mariprofundaceae bacterium]|nr:lipopolysaccharide heptosyltransferase II [Mariprofundaceae bacterium]
MPLPVTARHLALFPPNWIGDAVLAQPAMRAIVRHFNSRQVSVFGRPWLKDLLTWLDLPNASFHPEPPRDADIVFLFPNSFRSAWQAKNAGIDRRVGFRGQWRRFLLTDAPRPRINLKNEHHRDYYLDLPGQMGIATDEREVRLQAPAGAVEAGRLLLEEHGLEPERTICVAPGAQFGGAKRYPAEAYAHVLAWLAERGWQFVILGTSAEQTAGELCLHKITGSAWNATGRTTLQQALQLVSAARLLLTNDSGLMHVAAGLHKPTVALFGATDPARTSPSGARVRILYEPAPCSPCLERECSVSGHPCMGNILPEAVRDACLEMLA